MAHTQTRAEHRGMAGLASPSPLLWLGGGLPPRFRWVSPSLVQALGHPPEDWKTRGFVSRFVHPEDLDRLLDAWAVVARTGEPRTLELRAVSAEGGLVRLAVELNAVESSPDGAGELIGTVRVLAPSLLPDPGLKLAAPTNLEGELREKLDGLPGPAWMVGGDLAITWCSPEQGAQSMLGAAARAAEPQTWVSAHRRRSPGRRWASTSPPVGAPGAARWGP